MKTVKDFKVKDMRVLVRCDFNVPIDEHGVVLENFRIEKSLPTIQYLVKKKAKIIIISHLGEPDGKIVPALRLDNVGRVLENVIKLPVQKADDCVGPEVEEKISQLQAGQILLLENVRFHKEETDNDPAFAKALAGLGDLYINDAFADCHRAHASIVGIPKFLPSGAGLLVQDELSHLNKLLQKPKRPFVAIVGGKKVQTKSRFIEKISQIADVVLVSGLIKKELMTLSLTRTNIIGPENNLEAPDIDQAAIKMFTEKILAAKMIVWNGPFGQVEDERYQNGTREIAKTIIKSKAFSVAGGGETIAFLHQEGMLDKFSYISTGGGAMLDYLSGEVLPGLKALEQ